MTRRYILHLDVDAFFASVEEIFPLPQRQAAHRGSTTGAARRGHLGLPRRPCRRRPLGHAHRSSPALLGEGLKQADVRLIGAGVSKFGPEQWQLSLFEGTGERKEEKLRRLSQAVDRIREKLATRRYGGRRW